MQETRGLSPGSGRFPERGQGNPLQYSCLENPTEEPGGAAVHRVTQSQTQRQQLSTSGSIHLYDQKRKGMKVKQEV